MTTGTRGSNGRNRSSMHLRRLVSRCLAAACAKASRETVDRSSLFNSEVRGRPGFPWTAWVDGIMGVPIGLTNIVLESIVGTAHVNPDFVTGIVRFDSQVAVPAPTVIVLTRHRHAERSIRLHPREVRVQISHESLSPLRGCSVTAVSWDRKSARRRVGHRRHRGCPSLRAKVLGVTICRRD